MKISNSKKQLAEIIHENGGWRDGIEFCVSTASGLVLGSRNRPEYSSQYGWTAGGGFIGDRIELRSYLKNWHQTILSREEYLHLYPAPDDDGWIEWGGGERPVDGDELVVCKVRSGREWRDGKAIMAKVLRWRHTGGIADIIAYRLHKPEQEKPASEPVSEVKPTIEQLAADYRNLLDFALRKQEEADAAKADADTKLAELVAAGKALGLVLSVAEPEPEPEPELVITDWRDLKVGDEVEYVSGLIERRNGMIGIVVGASDEDDELNVKIRLPNGECGWPTKWRFIRRP